ncbi:MAG: cation:proton antiporter [Porphyromonadaceae bacterium]|nr:cation:proton antiporter [Porphyromonadaceae bacterium]
MSKRIGLRSVIFYIILLLSFVGAIGVTFYHGGELFSLSGEGDAIGGMSWGDAFDVFTQSVVHHLSAPIGLLLLQILIILVAARLMGALFRKIRQPAVIGEIVAGILLGPSLFGRVAPDLFARVFPAESLGNIEILSSFGLVLFMFVVGMELRLSDIKRRLRASLVISHAGIIIPFVLSLPLSLYIYPDYVGSYTPFLPFALFVGIAMSITAFPVLARIIQENNMMRTSLGKLSLSTAAAGDITAWLMLAGIIAISQSGSLLSTVYNLFFLLAYLWIIFGIIRPLFSIAGKVYNTTEVIGHTLVGVIFVLLLSSSFVTELLSMHALFGAFMLGLVMPEDLSFRKIISDKVEDVALMLFLPLFFVSSGLQTELGLVDGLDTWALLAVFVFIAVVGKVGGSYVAARVCGQKPKDSLYLGAFMNTRGLMELVVLAIGYQMHILPPKIYAVLVLMTVITTVMTMPLVHFINVASAALERRRLKRLSSPGVQLVKNGTYSVLLPFGRPRSGAKLLRLGDLLLRRGETVPRVTALHITTDKDINPIDADKYFEDSFVPISQEADRLGQAIEMDYQVSDNIEQTIIGKLKGQQYNMLLVGAGIKYSAEVQDQEAAHIRARLSGMVGSLSVATTERLLAIGHLVRDKMNYFVHHAPCSVGIFLERDFDRPQRILLDLRDESDLRLVSYARTLMENSSGAKLYIHASGVDGAQIQLGAAAERTTLLGKDEPIVVSPRERYDLLLLSYQAWMKYYDGDPDRLAMLPSTLILSLKTAAH